MSEKRVFRARACVRCGSRSAGRRSQASRIQALDVRSGPVHGNSSLFRIWQKQLQGPLGAKDPLTSPAMAHPRRRPIRSRTLQVRAMAGCIVAVARELGLQDAGGGGLEPRRTCRAQCGPLAADGGRAEELSGTPPISKTPDGFSGFKGLSATTFTPAPSDAEIAEWMISAFAPGVSADTPLCRSRFSPHRRQRARLSRCLRAGRLLRRRGRDRAQSQAFCLRSCREAKNRSSISATLQRLVCTDPVARTGSGHRRCRPRHAMGEGRRLRPDARRVRVEPLNAAMRLSCHHARKRVIQYSRDHAA